MWTKTFWQAVAERMLRGFAIGVLLVLGGDVASGAFNAFAVDWTQVLGYGLGGAFISLLLSVTGNAITKTGPSFNQKETLDAPPPGPHAVA